MPLIKETFFLYYWYTVVLWDRRYLVQLYK